jgi:N-ethylmaleimide reductase
MVNPAIGALEKKTDPEPRSMRMIELVREKYDGTLIVAGGFDSRGMAGAGDGRFDRVRP